jgi:hypothetical protein
MSGHRLWPRLRSNDRPPSVHAPRHDQLLRFRRRQRFFDFSDFGLTFLPSDPLISLTLSKDDPPSQCPKVAIWEAGRVQEKRREALDLLQGSF